MELYVKLAEVLSERELTQKDCVEMTGLRAATISEIVNNRRSSVNREHLGIIAKALNITDVRELLEFR